MPAGLADKKGKTSGHFSVREDEVTGRKKCSLVVEVGQLEEEETDSTNTITGEKDGYLHVVV